MEMIICLNGKSININETQNKYSSNYVEFIERSSSSNNLSKSITTYPSPQVLKGRNSEIRAGKGSHENLPSQRPKEQLAYNSKGGGTCRRLPNKTCGSIKSRKPGDHW